MSEDVIGNTNKASRPRKIRPYDSTMPVAFLHIPKSGGISLSDALVAALKPSAIFGAFDRCMFGDSADFESMSEAARGEILFASSDLPPGLDLVGGHLSFSAMSRAYPDAQFVTALREPMSRLISLWLFWRTRTDQYLEPWGTWGNLIRQSHLPLRDFVRLRNIACQTDNQCVRMLVWPHPLVPEGDFIDERDDEILVEEAKSRLEQFCFVDLLENPELVANLQSWLERPIILRKLNETNDIPESLKTSLTDELDYEALSLIEARSRLDLKLWSEVVAQRLPETDSRVLRDQIISKNLTNFSCLCERTS